MKRVLQLPPSRFGLPLVCSSLAGRVTDIGVFLPCGAGCRWCVPRWRGGLPMRGVRGGASVLARGTLAICDESVEEWGCHQGCYDRHDHEASEDFFADDSSF